MFSCEFYKISKNIFFYRTPPVPASVLLRSWMIIVEITNDFHPIPSVNNIPETLESIKSFEKHENIQRIKVSYLHCHELSIAYDVSEVEVNEEVLNLSHKKGNRTMELVICRWKWSFNIIFKWRTHNNQKYPICRTCQGSSFL